MNLYDYRIRKFNLDWLYAGNDPMAYETPEVALVSESTAQGNTTKDGMSPGEMLHTSGHQKVCKVFLGHVEALQRVEGIGIGLLDGEHPVEGLERQPTPSRAHAAVSRPAGSRARGRG